MSDSSDPTPAAWQVQQLRLTAFLAVPLDSRVAETLWKTTTGVPPDLDENRAREGLRRQSGLFRNGQLEIQIAPSRVDWIMLPQGPLAYFDTFADGMEIFRVSGPNWLDPLSGAVTRLGVGAALLMPVADKLEGYRKLKAFLKTVQVDPENSSDLVYQVNWPRPSSALPGLTLNRITAWQPHVVHRQPGVQMTPHGLQPLLLGNEQQFCRLDCDHNTPDGHTAPFTDGTVAPLFHELCALVSENAQHGEVTING